jgi:hypothetical protein
MQVLDTVKSVRQHLAKKTDRDRQEAVQKLNQLQSQVRDPNSVKQFANAEVLGHLVDIMTEFRKSPPIQLPVIIVFMALSLNPTTSVEVGKHGGLQVLVDAVVSTEESLVKQHGSGALRNLCMNDSNRNIMITISDAPKKLVSMLGANVLNANQLPVGANIVDNLLAILSLLAKEEELSVELGQKCGLLPILYTLFSLPLKEEVYKTVLLNALRLIQFLAHWSEITGAELVKNNIVQHIVTFTKVKDDNIAKLCSNILQMIPSHDRESQEATDTSSSLDANAQLDSIIDNLGNRERRPAAVGLLHTFVEGKLGNVKLLLDHEVDILGTLMDLFNLNITSLAPGGNTQLLESLAGCLLEIAKHPLAMGILAENRETLVPNIVNKTLWFALDSESKTVRNIDLLLNGLALIGMLTFNKDFTRSLLAEDILGVYNQIYSVLLLKAGDRDYSQALSFIVKAFINLGRDDATIMVMKGLGIIDKLVQVTLNEDGRYSSPALLRQEACTALWNMSNCEEARAYIHSLDCYAVMAEMLPAIELASTNAATAQKALGVSEEALAQALLKRRTREDVERLKKILDAREQEIAEQEDDDLDEFEGLTLEPEDDEELQPEEDEELQPEEDLDEELQPEPEPDELNEVSKVPKYVPPQKQEIVDDSQELQAVEYTPAEEEEEEIIEEDLTEDEIEEIRRKKRMIEEREEARRKKHEERVLARREQRKKERQAIKDQETAEQEKKNKKASKRRMLCMELLSTEEAYVKALAKVEQLYMIPLSTTHAGLLPPDKFKIIFGDIKIIHKINEDFHREMEILYQKDDFWGKEEQYLGNFFLKRMTTFKLYTNYVNGYTAADACMHDMVRKNRKFGDFLDAISDKLVEERSRQTDLASFLIQPIQRLPRYSLLLTDILRNTDYNETHSAYLLLESALLEVQNITTFVNEGKRNNEQVNQARDLIKKLNLTKQMGETKRALIRSEKDFSYVSYDKYRPNATRSKSYKCKLHIFDDCIVIIRDSIVTKAIIISLLDCKVKNKVLDKDREGRCFTIEDERAGSKAHANAPELEEVYEIDCGVQSLRNDVVGTIRNLATDLRLKKKKIIQM